MNSITIDGVQYEYSVKSGAIRKFEGKTGESLFNLDRETLEGGKVSFTDIFGFVCGCVKEMTEEILDEVDVEEVFMVFSEIISGKKRDPGPEESSTSNDLHTSTELLPENGQEPLQKTETSQNTLSLHTSEEEREKIISGISEEGLTG